MNLLIKLNVYFLFTQDCSLIHVTLQISRHILKFNWQSNTYNKYAYNVNCGTKGLSDQLYK